MPSNDSSLLTAHDAYLLREGTHARLYQSLGCHLRRTAGVPAQEARGADFAVWARTRLRSR